MSDIEHMAETIAKTIFYHHFDAERAVRLTNLLIAFAAEVKRAAIEGDF